MSHIIFRFIFFGINVLSLFVIAKVLTQDYKPRLKDTVYIVTASLLCATVFSIAFDMRIHSDTLFASFYVIGYLLLVFFYVHKLTARSVKKSIIIAIFAEFFSTIVFLSVHAVIHLFFTPMRVRYWTFEQALLLIPYVLLLIIFSVAIALFVVKATVKLRKFLNNNDAIQTMLLIGSVLTYLIVNAITTLGVNVGDNLLLSDWFYTLLISGYSIAMVLSFFAYSKFIRTKHTLQQEQREREILQYYTKELEEQQLIIRKFKHDQENLFSTLDVYMHEKDWDGLTEFYSQVRDASEAITHREFALEDLSNIKVQEFKNILTAKLTMAQQLGLNVTFEAGNEINDIPIKLVALVRMVGIILDNAIEELQSLGSGELIVGCFNIKDSVNFVVKNSCRADIPPLRQLQQSGFSTKGKERGLGLNNLSELVDSLPNLALMTEVENGYFTQTLMIGGTE